MLAKYRYLQWVFTLSFVVISCSFAGGWEQVSELPTWRIGAAAAAVDGQIYLIGGFDPRENLGGGAPAISRVDVYDTRTNTWHTVSDMPIPRIAARAAVFSNEIYVFGGYNRTAVRGEPWKTVVEMYDTQTDTWTRLRDMSTLLRNFGTAVVDEKIYIIGGTVLDRRFDHQVPTNRVEVYDPLTDKWEKRADMPTEREQVGTGVVDGKIYVIGGYDRLAAGGFGDAAKQFLTQIEEYNPKIDRWRKLRNMPVFKFSFATVVVNNEIYTIGGASLDHRIGRIDTVEVYNPTVNRWRILQPITIPKTTTAAVANGTIYLFGGLENGRKFSPVVEAFDTGFRAINAKDKLPTRWGELKKSDAIVWFP